jgi:hypothetical protein
MFHVNIVCTVLDVYKLQAEQPKWVIGAMGRATATVFGVHGGAIPGKPLYFPPFGRSIVEIGRRDCQISKGTSPEGSSSH